MRHTPHAGEEPEPWGLGYDPEVLQRLIDGPTTTPEQRAQLALPLAKHGEIGGGHSGRGTDSTSAETRGGNPEYRVARLARDAPATLERIKACEFKSVRAVAREAGLVTLTCTVPLDPQRAGLMG